MTQKHSILSQLYHGFTIDAPVGNNAFSYARRSNKEIYVAPIITQGKLTDLAVGDKIVFSEIENGQEINPCGLKNFLDLPTQSNKRIFIFDNHNHAFFFWIYALQSGLMQPDLPLVHVDQHRDFREPESYLSAKDWKSVTIETAFRYTQEVLNVGNFIRPALALKIFSETIFVDHQTAFETSFPQEFVLDLDLDIFAPIMAYIDFDLKLHAVKRLIAQAQMVTIATSPFFLDQSEALRLIPQLLFCSAKLK